MSNELENKSINCIFLFSFFFFRFCDTQMFHLSKPFATECLEIALNYMHRVFDRKLLKDLRRLLSYTSRRSC